jgi:uncharacterized membrane protein YhaH (DUF805 family)
MLRFLFSPYGRISRKTYWLNWIVPYIALALAVVLLDFVLFPISPATGEPPPVLQSILGLAAIWPSIAVATKRLHDRGMTGWWNAAPLLLVVPLAVAAYWYYYSTKMAAGDPAAVASDPALGGIVGGAAGILFVAIVAWVILYPAINILFLRGQSGANKYGDDPLGHPADTFT